MGRDVGIVDTQVSLVFQSTRPRGARPRRDHCDTFCTGFNPRAHVGRDAEHVAPVEDVTVSIHAPTWGATQRWQLPQLHCGFNPRAHVGRDDGETISGGVVLVSIHAPTWGATVDPKG